jgi:hypothetical protein
MAITITSKNPTQPTSAIAARPCLSLPFCADARSLRPKKTPAFPVENKAIPLAHHANNLLVQPLQRTQQHK